MATTVKSLNNDLQMYGFKRTVKLMFVFMFICPWMCLWNVPSLRAQNGLDLRLLVDKHIINIERFVNF